jgi:hypothetical protein
VVIVIFSKAADEPVPIVSGVFKIRTIGVDGTLLGKTADPVTLPFPTVISKLISDKP